MNLSSTQQPVPAGTLTAEAIISAAQVRGIFALPTRVGERGVVHLGSFGVDWTNDANREQLFALIDSGAIKAITVWAGAVVRSSLIARGLDPDWFDDRIKPVVRSAMLAYDAIFVEAVAITCATITPEHLNAMQGNAATWAAQRGAREQAATLWNRCAGIVTDGPYLVNGAVVQGSVVAVDIEHYGEATLVPYYAIVKWRGERSALLDYAAGTRDDRIPIRGVRLVTDPQERAVAVDELTRAGLIRG